MEIYLYAYSTSMTCINGVSSTNFTFMTVSDRHTFFWLPIVLEGARLTSAIFIPLVTFQAI